MTSIRTRIEGHDFFLADSYTDHDGRKVEQWERGAIALHHRGDAWWFWVDGISVSATGYKSPNEAFQRGVHALKTRRDRIVQILETL